MSSPTASARPNSLVWIFDAFEHDASYLHKKMFGCDAAYVDGRLCLVAADREAPWDGLLVCTAQDQHAALVAEIPALRTHPVLGKWLYVPQTDPAFEEAVEAITLLVRNRDPRIGVEPKPRKPRRQAVRPER